ncbi:ribosomal maturation YjgA family protein [Bacillus changyiensis]|uniref:ribosomal maturation YjgA family protein n=1 Tax=Bacillus changyiensis TaxID=3004103 RepID=UPI0022DEDE3C|nr:DUF2809 domain-containing protein [Bacillus changyiensis]MDA1477964.1 DUF2809 domain-containing protein [Bacillus changyiensis]
MIRKRLLYAILMTTVMVTGIFSRKMTHLLPDLVNAYLGDALWALMMFFGFGFLLKKSSTKIIALTALLFCYTIEFSQLYHAPWIDQLRNTTIGGLVLGYGFLWSDLLAYLLGIGTGVICEQKIINKISHLRKN